MSIEGYISNDVEEVEVEVEVEVVKKKKTSRTATVRAEEDHELTRKRDILASVALLGELESYIGENFSAMQIRNMKKEKLESYFTLYQVKAGQEATNEMMSSLLEISIKGLSYVVNIDSQEDLKNDLINNKQLRKTVGRQAAEITEKYGDFVAIAKVLFTVGNHISFSSDTSKCSQTATVCQIMTTTTDEKSDIYEEIEN